MTTGARQPQIELTSFDQVLPTSLATGRYVPGCQITGPFSWKNPILVVSTVHPQNHMSPDQGPHRRVNCIRGRRSTRFCSSKLPERKGPKWRRAVYAHNLVRCRWVRRRYKPEPQALSLVYRQRSRVGLANVEVDFGDSAAINRVWRSLVVQVRHRIVLAFL